MFDFIIVLIELGDFFHLAGAEERHFYIPKAGFRIPLDGDMT